MQQREPDGTRFLVLERIEQQLGVLVLLDIFGVEHQLVVLRIL